MTTEPTKWKLIQHVRSDSGHHEEVSQNVMLTFDRRPTESDLINLFDQYGIGIDKRSIAILMIMDKVVLGMQENYYTLSEVAA